MKLKEASLSIFITISYTSLELFLEGTHEKYNILFKPYNKTTINIMDDEGMYFHQEIFTRFKINGSK